MTDSELAALGVDRVTFDALVSRKVSEIRGGGVRTVQTRDGGEVEIAPRFETKAPYWVEPTISIEDRIAERDIERIPQNPDSGLARISICVGVHARKRQDEKQLSSHY